MLDVEQLGPLMFPDPGDEFDFSDLSGITEEKDAPGPGPLFT
jgi:hypothetical protein